MDRESTVGKRVSLAVNTLESGASNKNDDYPEHPNTKQTETCMYLSNFLCDLEWDLLRIRQLFNLFRIKVCSLASIRPQVILVIINLIHLQGDHNHLFIRQGTGLQGQAVFRTKLTFRPHSTESFTHRKMTLSLADRSQKSTGIKVLSQVGHDPDAHKNEMIKVRIKYTYQLDNTGGLSLGFLVYRQC